jgi:antirestriction protein ArdC
MSRSIAALAPVQSARSLYQEIINKIITELKAAAFRGPSRGGPWRPKRRARCRRMRRLIATTRGSMCSSCGAPSSIGDSAPRIGSLSARPLRLGGNGRKGERGTTVLYADHFVSDEERRRAERDGGEPNAIRFLKRFTVFNTDQCEDLPREVASAPSPIPEGLVEAQAETLIAATGAD